MKFIILLGLVSAVFSAPQPRKVFHETFSDFLELIEDTIGDDISDLMQQYAQFEEFAATIDYMTTTNFKDLVYEMEHLPEFSAVVDFLETHSIDITFFIDIIDTSLGTTNKRMIRNSRQSPSGLDFNSYLKDLIALFPKEQLAALYDEKIATDADFKAAIEGLQSDEWNQIFDALWENEVFLSEVEALKDNGLDVGALLDQLLAVFGQN